MTPVKTRRVEGRTGMTPRTSGRGRTAATARTPSAVPRPAQQSQEKNNDKSHDQDDSGGLVLFQPVKLPVRDITSYVLSVFPDLGVTVSSGLVASVQSLVAILQRQIDTSSHQTPADSQNASTSQTLPTDNVIYCGYLSRSLVSRASVFTVVDFVHDLYQFDEQAD